MTGGRGGRGQGGGEREGDAGENENSSVSVMISESRGASDAPPNVFFSNETPIFFSINSTKVNDSQEIQ